MTLCMALGPMDIRLQRKKLVGRKVVAALYTQTLSLTLVLLVW